MSLTMQETGSRKIVASEDVVISNKQPKKLGILEGRTVAPCKSTRWLTDMQIRKIKIIALAIILSLGPILVGVLTGGLGAIICGAMFAMSGVVLGGGLFIHFWPRADFQTSKGAEIILNDLKTQSLSELQSNYNFSDLSHYGYISEKDAAQMQSLYNQMPHYQVVRDGDHVNAYASFCVNRVNGVHERRREIDQKFDALRAQRSFGVWK